MDIVSYRRSCFPNCVVKYRLSHVAAYFIVFRTGKRIEKSTNVIENVSKIVPGPTQSQKPDRLWSFIFPNDEIPVVGRKEDFIEPNTIKLDPPKKHISNWLWTIFPAASPGEQEAEETHTGKPFGKVPKKENTPLDVVKSKASNADGDLDQFGVPKGEGSNPTVSPTASSWAGSLFADSDIENVANSLSDILAESYENSSELDDLDSRTVHQKDKSTHTATDDSHGYVAKSDRHIRSMIPGVDEKEPQHSAQPDSRISKENIARQNLAQIDLETSEETKSKSEKPNASLSWVNSLFADSEVTDVAASWLDIFTTMDNSNEQVGKNQNQKGQESERVYNGASLDFDRFFDKIRYSFNSKRQENGKKGQKEKSESSNLWVDQIFTDFPSTNGETGTLDQPTPDMFTADIKEDYFGNSKQVESNTKSDNFNTVIKRIQDMFPYDGESEDNFAVSNFFADLFPDDDNGDSHDARKVITTKEKEKNDNAQQFSLKLFIDRIRDIFPHNAEKVHKTTSNTKELPKTEKKETLNSVQGNSQEKKGIIEKMKATLEESWDTKIKPNEKIDSKFKKLFEFKSVISF
jgi:hypothetical protein